MRIKVKEEAFCILFLPLVRGGAEGGGVLFRSKITDPLGPKGLRFQKIEYNLRNRELFSHSPLVRGRKNAELCFFTTIIVLYGKS